jgi:benzoylformate decarboxylase
VSTVARTAGGRTTAADAALRALLEAGVDRVFGNPGTTELPLIQALARGGGPEYVLALHEGAVVSAAAGYALASGRPAVAAVHVMPGLGNAMSMYHSAQRANVPLVLIAGAQDRRTQHLNPILHGDMTAVMRPLSKSVWEAKTAEEVPDVLVRALRSAAAAPTGPVFVSVPIDLWDQPVRDVPVRATVAPVRLGEPDPGAVRDICDLLARAEEPVLLCGDAVGFRSASEAAVELAELIGAAAYWPPHSLIASYPSTSFCYRGAIFPDAGSFERALGEADVLLSVAADVVPSVLFEVEDLIPRAVEVAGIAETPSDSTGLLDPAVSAYGDLEKSMRALSAEMRKRIDSDRDLAATVELRRDALRQGYDGRREKLRAKALGRPVVDGRMHPSTAIAAILEGTPREATIVDEAVSNSGWVTLLGDLPKPCSYVSLVRGGSLGYGLGMAIGTHLATDRAILLLLGDGALAYANQGLWTIAHERLPVVTCVINNGGYGALTSYLASPHFRSEAVSEEEAERAADALLIRDPDLDVLSMGRTYGVEGSRVSDPDRLREAVAAALAARKPMLIDVPVT